MKKHTEKQPIDELFARKLGNASLTPKSDGFARLQARMGQHRPEPKMVFWRNPAIQRYMAAAACLLLVCLFGWLYWPSAGTVGQGENQLAMNQPAKSALKKPVQKDLYPQPNDQLSATPKQEASTPEVNTDQVAMADKSSKIVRAFNGKNNLDSGQQTPVQPKQVMSVAPMVAQEKPNTSKSKIDGATPAFSAPTTPLATEQVADAKPQIKPDPATERVLVVTIAEPEALIAARQAAKTSVEEKAALAQNEKSVKETKGGGLWQQVKRIKQGDVFARQDNTDNDESGLLGKAYNGLRHSLEKDKSTKQ